MPGLRFALVMLSGLACTPSVEPAAVVSPNSAVQAEAYAPGPELAAAVDTLDRRIAFLTERLAARPSRTHALDLMATHMRRARLLGDWDDFAAAEEALKQARDAGPLTFPVEVATAGLDQTLHRVREAQAALDRAAALHHSSDDERALALARAGLAFASGDYDTARAVHEQLATDPSFATEVARGVFAWRTGDLASAADALATAERLHHAPDPMARAWLSLQRGRVALDRGDIDTAKAHYSDAETALPGWWQTARHRAELAIHEHREDDAVRDYRIVVHNTGDPDAMMDLAALIAHRSQDPQSLIDEAGRIHTERMARFPDAAAGHAMRWHLTYGDPATALHLAESDAARRPNGETRLLYAEALLANGRTEDAVREVEAVSATAWNTPHLHQTAITVYEAADDTAARDRHIALLGDGVGHVHADAHAH